MSLEQQEIKLRIEEARKKAAEARRTGETRELGELVEGLVAPIGRSEEASFLLMRFLFLSILLALAYAVQGVVISVGFGIAEGVDILGGSFNQELLYVVAQLVQIIAQVVVALVAFVFGVPLFVDVQKFLRER